MSGILALILQKPLFQLSGIRCGRSALRIGTLNLGFKDVSALGFGAVGLGKVCG